MGSLGRGPEMYQSLKEEQQENPGQGETVGPVSLLPVYTGFLGWKPVLPQRHSSKILLKMAALTNLTSRREEVPEDKFSIKDAKYHKGNQNEKHKKIRDTQLPHASYLEDFLVCFNEKPQDACAVSTGEPHLDQVCLTQHLYK